MRVRHVVRGEEERLRALRLAALAADPDAFGSTHARDAARPAAWWAAWTAESEDGTAQRTFVLEADDGRWLGLALVRREDDGARLYAMWVAPEGRGRGAGRALCDACADWAAARGCDALRLDVVVGNDAAVRAYEAAGFAVSGRATRSREGRTLDELVMTRAL